jgi:DNA-binding NarL/FixJ family response regulator
MNNDSISVLIVEDEIIIAMEIETELLNQGFNVVGTVIVSEDVVGTAASLRPDVILMDIQIGDGKDGITLSEEIYALYRPVIIFVSAYDDDETRKRAGLLQQHYFLPKPFTYDELVSVIRESVSKNRVPSVQDREQADP